MEHHSRPGEQSGYVNNLIIAGHTSIFQACSGTGCGEYVVQPPVGKLAIAVGEWIYGLTTLGWRLAPAVFGTLAILVMCRVARRITRSTLLGCTAGLLLSLDGLEFVLSRTGILDIFLMFFVLAAFGALVVDRDVSRERLAQAVVLRPGDQAGPALGIRKWRVLAGVLIGLACATKQYGAWYIFAFAGLCIAWDLGARRAAGLRDYRRGALVRDGKWLPLTLGVIPLVTYTLTWLGWLITSTGYDRNWAQQNGVSNPVIAPLYSLFQYHKEMLQFGVGLKSPHPYMSQPWDWFVISRPVSFYWESFADPAGQHLWTKPNSTGPYVQEVLAIGNPAIWWISHSRAALLPRLVADPQGLAGRRGRARRGRGLGDLAAVRVADQVLLLRARIRAVPDHRHRAVPRPDPRRCLFPAAPGDRVGGRRPLRPRRPCGVLVLLPDPLGQDHHVLDWLHHMWYTGLLGPASGWI